MDTINEALVAKASQAASSLSQLPELPTLDYVSKPPSVTWQDAARKIELKPRSDLLGEFERSVLGSARVLSSEFDCGLCQYCGRPVLAQLLSQHEADCKAHNRTNGKDNRSDATVKGEQDVAEMEDGVDDDEDDDDGDDPDIDEDDVKSSIATSSAKMTSGARGSNRKRKNPATGSGENGAAKKRAKTIKPRPAKPKAPRPARVPKEKVVQPFNPDKQCGVPLPNGQVCQRSLTCKAHSMGAKRQVVGRSAPYDVLLSQYQRQNQVKQAQLSTANASALAESDQQLEAQVQLNPEHEVQQVLEGVRRAYCAPLDKATMMPTRIRTRQFRLREMMALALLPKGISPAGDSIFGRSLVFRPEAPNATQYMRAPAMQRAMLMAQLHHQRQLQMQQANVQVPDGRPVHQKPQS